MSKKQTAVLVDAGYFFAQATETLFGASRPRHEIEMDEAKTLLCIEEMAKRAFPGREILRVYWYDAPPSKQVEMSPSQERLALKPGVKMRLGSLNGSGQQKGVDALIIHDLTQLARDGAADRFVLVSGDEDLRLAVEQAQACGAQVRLLAVGPGHASVGVALRREVDGIDHFDAELLAKCVSSRSGPGAEVRGTAEKPGRKSARKGAKPKPRGSEPTDAKEVMLNAHSTPQLNAPRQGHLNHIARSEPSGSRVEQESHASEGVNSARQGEAQRQQQEGVGRGKRRRSRGKNRPGRTVESPGRQNLGARRDAQDFQVVEAPRDPAPFGVAPGSGPASAGAFLPATEPVAVVIKAQSGPVKKARAPRGPVKKSLPVGETPVKKARVKKSVTPKNQEAS